MGLRHCHTISSGYNCSECRNKKKAFLQISKYEYHIYHLTKPWRIAKQARKDHGEWSPSRLETTDAGECWTNGISIWVYACTNCSRFCVQVTDGNNDFWNRSSVERKRCSWQLRNRRRCTPSGCLRQCTSTKCAHFRCRLARIIVLSKWLLTLKLWRGASFWIGLRLLIFLSH